MQAKMFSAKSILSVLAFLAMSAMADDAAPASADLDIDDRSIRRTTPKPTVAPAPPTAVPTTKAPTGSPTVAPVATAPTPIGTGTGDPHFKTWSGNKFDYHGECDLVLVDNPHFGNGLGLRVHVRTTRMQYYSFIEKVAVKIGEDVLEFANNVANVTLNGAVAAVKEGKRKIFMAGTYEVVRYKKSVIVRLDKANHANIDLIVRKVGWPSVKMEAGTSHVFHGSLGLLGEYTTGKRLARDGVTEMNNDDATDYALEWQVRDTEPLLFSDARAPQYPSTCKAASKMMFTRLGLSLAKKEAEKVCAAWGDDIDDCIFDVIASRNILSAEQFDE
jgi:von Willebrand factor type D domain